VFVAILFADSNCHDSILLRHQRAPTRFDSRRASLGVPPAISLTPGDPFYYLIVRFFQNLNESVRLNKYILKPL